MKPLFLQLRSTRLPIAGLVLALFTLVWLAGCKPATGPTAGGPRYHCPMHPTFVKDRPGDCAICNMKLVPIKESTAPAKTNEVATPPAEAAPARVAIAVSPEKQQLIGLKTTTVEERELTQIIRATAVVQHDETRFARIAPRFGGWVQKLMLDFTGQGVTSGAPILTVYSPEVLATEREYLLARQQLTQTAAHPGAPELAATQRMLDSARQRLALFGIGPEEIRALEGRGEPDVEVLLRAPVSGHVVTKNAVEGKAFMAGETLYELADLHHVWLRVSVNETDFPRVSVGQRARVLFPQLGDRAFTNQVTFIYPHLDAATRRGEARVELENHDHLLRPDMWANVDLDVNLGRVLAVPASAVIDTGTGHVAFVRGDDDHLHPRQVVIGRRTDDFYEVTAGLKAGETVVTRALFLIDAESQLKAAIASMTGHE